MIQIQIHFSPTLFGLFSFNAFSSSFLSLCSSACEIFFNILILVVVFWTLYIYKKNVVWEIGTHSLSAVLS